MESYVRTKSGYCVDVDGSYAEPLWLYARHEGYGDPTGVNVCVFQCNQNRIKNITFEFYHCQDLNLQLLHTSRLKKTAFNAMNNGKDFILPIRDFKRLILFPFSF